MTDSSTYRSVRPEELRLGDKIMIDDNGDMTSPSITATVHTVTYTDQHVLIETEYEFHFALTHYQTVLKEIQE